MLTRISRRIELDYGHTLPNHYSFCNQIHGHRGIVEAFIVGAVSDTDGDSSEGMVVDFKHLKEAMMKFIHDPLDHGFAVWKEDAADLAFIQKRNSKVLVTSDPPTAEYLARWAYEQLQAAVPLFSSDKLILEKVRWYETPTSWAEYPAEELK